MSSEITESGLQSNLLAVIDAQAFNCEKRQRIDAFAGGANTPGSFVSAGPVILQGKTTSKLRQL